MILWKNWKYNLHTWTYYNVKLFTATLTETEKKLNKFYNIRINFAKLRIHMFETLAKIW